MSLSGRGSPRASLEIVPCGRRYVGPAHVPAQARDVTERRTRVQMQALALHSGSGAAQISRWRVACGVWRRGRAMEDQPWGQWSAARAWRASARVALQLAYRRQPRGRDAPSPPRRWVCAVRCGRYGGTRARAAAPVAPRRRRRSRRRRRGQRPSTRWPQHRASPRQSGAATLRGRRRRREPRGG